ncbi:MAG: hypothetical protein GY810_01625 [Aureispira sp.]|nr:hypothetical protein [Aureispira sp.]
MFEFWKAIHFIGLVSWFAGLFYLPRLFIYHVEALDDKDTKRGQILVEQFSIMEGRLYKIIMNPALIITFIGGVAMIYVRGWEWWKFNLWLHWKLLLVFGLVAYHHYCGRLIKRLANGEKVMTSTKLRLFNEITTLFLLAIVLLAVYKGRLNFVYAFFGLVGTGILLGMGVKWYKKIRMNADK